MKTNTFITVPTYVYSIEQQTNAKFHLTLKYQQRILIQPHSLRTNIHVNYIKNSKHKLADIFEENEIKRSIQYNLLMQG